MNIYKYHIFSTFKGQHREIPPTPNLLILYRWVLWTTLRLQALLFFVQNFFYARYGGSKLTFSKRLVHRARAFGALVSMNGRTAWTLSQAKENRQNYSLLPHKAQCPSSVLISSMDLFLFWLVGIRGRGGLVWVGGIRGRGGLVWLGGIRGRGDLDWLGGIRGRGGLDWLGGIRGRGGLDWLGGIRGRGQPGLARRHQSKGPNGLVRRHQRQGRPGLARRHQRQGRPGLEIGRAHV